ncbi:MAG: hypothetical protein FWB91_03175 [Defluviitaleaceae bacterium]|nr:hypothetical protein [Defluviitaleaceae bacterium]
MAVTANPAPDSFQANLNWTAAPENLSKKLETTGFSDTELTNAIKTFDANLSPNFDDIYIDGKPVSDLCKNKTADYMKCFVTAAAMGRKSHIDRVVPGEDGQPKIVPMHAKVQGDPEPKKPSFFSRRWFREKLGLAKPPLTSQEQYEKDIVNNDPDRESRNAAIIHDAKKKEKLRENLEHSKTVANGIDNDRRALARALFGTLGDNDFGPNLGVNPGPHVSSNRSGINICIANLYNQGHSFEDILDPNKLKEEKSIVGANFMAMAHDNASGEESSVEHSRRAVAGILKTFAEKYAELPIQNIDYTSMKDIAGNYRSLHCRGWVSFDLSQECERDGVKEIIQTQLGDKFDHIHSTIGGVSQLYNQTEYAGNAYKVHNGDVENDTVSLGMQFLNTNDQINSTLSNAQTVGGVYKQIKEAGLLEILKSIYVQGAELNIMLSRNPDMREKACEALMLGVDVVTIEKTEKGNKYGTFFPAIDIEIDYYKPTTEAQVIPKEEAAKIVESFQGMAKERADWLDNMPSTLDKDFFPHLYENGKLDSKRESSMKADNMGGLGTLDRNGSRISLAQMYMLSKGDSLDDMYENTQTARDLRQQRGKELMGILKSQDPEKMGEMFADIGKSLADFPVPDVTSDAAIYKNMRQVNFITNAGINFNQIMNARPDGNTDYTPVEQAYRNNMTQKDWLRADTAVMAAQALKANGVTARIDVMGKGEYTLSPKEDGNASDSSYSFNRQRVEAIEYSNRKDFIKANYKPGTKLGDCGQLLEKSNKVMTPMIQKRGMEDPGILQKELSGTITNDEIRQIQKQVPGLQPVALQRAGTLTNVNDLGGNQRDNEPQNRISPPEVFNFQRRQRQRPASAKSPGQSL